MTKKFLLGMLAIALAFGMMVTGCSKPDDHTVSLTSAGENAIYITLRGASWKDPDNLEIQTALLYLLDWTSTSGNISSILKMNTNFTLDTDSVIKCVFSSYSEQILGETVGYTGSGTIKLKDLSGAKLFGALELVTKYMDPLGVWSIGENDPVTLNLK